MEEKKVTKISLSTFFLILSVIVIIVMAYFIYRISNEKTVEKEKVANLNNEVSSLQNTVNNLNEKINNVSNIVNSSDESNKANINTTSLKNGSSLVQFDTTFYNLEDVALEYRECSKISNYKDFEYDLDGDGKKDKITVKNTGKDELRK